jgi:hypothetical protein
MHLDRRTVNVIATALRPQWRSLRQRARPG